MISTLTPIQFEMIIRKASREDSRWILHHRVEMFKDMGESEVSLSETTRLTERYLESDWTKEYLYFLVEEGDKVIGGCGISTFRLPPKSSQPKGIYAYMSNMYIEPEFRRKGIGRLLVDYLTDFCKQNKIGLLLLHASEKGFLLYKTLGFTSPENLMELPTFNLE